MTIVNVGTTGDYPPFSVWNEEGLSGFDIEVLERFCRDVGYRLKFFKTEWPNLESDLKSGCFDIACGGISLTSVRSKSFLFSGPINRDGKVILVHKDDVVKYL